LNDFEHGLLHGIQLANVEPGKYGGMGHKSWIVPEFFWLIGRKDTINKRDI
jgi:hypothetical protein